MLVPAFASVLLALFLQAEGLRQLEHERDPNLPTQFRNLLRLVCISTEDVQPIPNALFFLDGDLFFDLADPQAVVENRPVNVNADGAGIVFFITREAEGSYSCGIREGLSTSMSPGIQFVALPIPGQRPNTNTPPPSSFKVGSTARINCTETPGRLIDQYFITWRNSSSDEILAEIPNNPNNLPSNIQNSRYSVDPVTFALLIENVTLLDSAPTYQCELGVVNVQGSFNVFNYPRSPDLELLVYEPPVITVPPESTVVSAEATPNTVYFQCTAVGSHTPIISWKHLGEEATSRDKYITTMERFSTPRGGRGITSTLTLLDIRAQDTGMVECEADAPPSVETNNQQLPGDSASAPLTVLEAHDNLMVFITTSRGVIFSVAYSVVPLHPVQLFLRYYEVGGAQQFREDSPGISYSNMSEMNYIALGSTVPFDTFRVEITLFHEETGVFGPGKNDTLVYDKDDPSEIDAIIQEAIVPGVVATGVVALLIILSLVTIFCFCYCRLKRKGKMADEERDDVKDYADMRAKNLLEAMDTIKAMSEQKNSCEDKKVMLQMMAELVKAISDIPVTLDLAVRVRASSQQGGTKVNGRGSHGAIPMEPLPNGNCVIQVHAASLGASVPDSGTGSGTQMRIESDDAKLIEEESMEEEYEMAYLFAAVAHGMIDLGMTHNVLKDPLKETLKKNSHLKFMKEEEG